MVEREEKKNANAPTQEFKNVFRKLLSNKDDPQYKTYEAQLKRAGFKYDGTKQTHRFSRVKPEDSSPKNRVKKRVKFEESEAKPLIKRVKLEPLKGTVVREKDSKGNLHYSRTEYTINVKSMDDDSIILEAKEAFDRIPAHDQEDTFTITAFGTPDETLNDYIFGTIALPRKEAFESFVNVLRELSERYEQDRNVVVEKLKVNVYTLNKERGGLGRSHNAANSTWKIVDPGKLT